MVYYTDTLEPCHPLTEKGMESYRLMLEEKQKEYDRTHPIRYLFRYLKQTFLK